MKNQILCAILWIALQAQFVHCSEVPLLKLSPHETEVSVLPVSTAESSHVDSKPPTDDSAKQTKIASESPRKQCSDGCIIATGIGGISLCGLTTFVGIVYLVVSSIVGPSYDCVSKDSTDIVDSAYHFVIRNCGSCSTRTSPKYCAPQGQEQYGHLIKRHEAGYNLLCNYGVTVCLEKESSSKDCISDGDKQDDFADQLIAQCLSPRWNSLPKNRTSSKNNLNMSEIRKQLARKKVPTVAAMLKKHRKDPKLQTPHKPKINKRMK